MRAVLLVIFLFPFLLIATPFPHFDQQTVQEFKGKVESIQTFDYATRPNPHKQIILRTRAGDIAIDLGPVGYLETIGAKVAPGEEILVKGSLLRFNGTPFVIASSVTKEGVTYTLRDEKGAPLWRGGVSTISYEKE